MTGPQNVNKIELDISDPAELRPLREWLARARGIDIDQVAGIPGQGELGTVDILTILSASGGALAVAIRTLPDFIRSRRSDLTITAKIDGKEFTLQAANVDDATAIICRLIDD